MHFTQCDAGTVGGVSIQAGSGHTIDMVDASQNVISTGTLFGDTDVVVTYEGP